MVIQFNSDEKEVLLAALSQRETKCIELSVGEFGQEFLDEAHSCSVLYDRVFNAFPVEILDEIWSDPVPNIDEEKRRGGVFESEVHSGE